MPPFQITPAIAQAPGKPAPAKVGKAPAPKAAPKSAPNYSSPLYNPSQQLSGKALATAAGNIASAQTAGPISELAKQMAVNDTQGKNAARDTAGYYMQLAKDAQAGLNQTTGIASDLSNQLQGINVDTQNQLSQFGQNATNGALGRMGALGLDAGQIAQLQGTAAQQQGLGALNAQTFRSAGANQGANYRSAAASNLGSDALQGTASLGDIGRATQLANEPLNAKIAALDEKQGALTGTALAQLRAAERSYQISQQGLGIRTQANKITAANDVARNNLTAAGQAITKQNDLANQAAKAAALAQKTKNDAATQAWRALQAGAKSGKPLSGANQIRAYGQISHIEGLIQQAQQGGITNDNQIRSLLAAKFQYPDTFVEAAFELLGWGALTPKTAGELHGFGLRGGTFRGAPIKVQARPGPAKPYTGPIPPLSPSNNGLTP